jgi:acyl-CoA synthetase (AMP-forming)/AMP-acid ligase II
VRGQHATADLLGFTRTVGLARISDYPAYFAEHTPGADAVVSAEEVLDHREFEDRIRTVARALLAAGVRRGDRVATLSPPSRHHLVQFMAAGRIGAAWVGLNPRYTADELDVVLLDAAPRVVLATMECEGRDYAETFAQLRAGSLADALLVSLDRVEEGFLAWDEFLDLGREVGPRQMSAAEAVVDEDDIAVIVYTSGTTGRPKGAMLSHRSVVTTARIQCEHWWAEPFRILNNLPINHIGGAVQIACHALVAGGANVVMPRFDPGSLPAVVRERQVTVLHQVPTMYQLLLERGRPTAADFASVQVLIWSGAPAPLSQIRQLRSLCAGLFTSYGQTETGGEVLYAPSGADDVELSASVGLPDARLEVRVGEEAGSTEGELQVRGPTVMSGYHHRLDDTAAAFTDDGWLRTGDLAAIGPDGRYRIVGRLRDMYKSGGYNVYPREVEQVLELHPAVHLAAVVAVPDRVYGEVGEAWILADGEVDDAALDAHCRQHLANYKVPKSFRVRAELPMLPIGKIDKVALRRSAAG